MRAWALGFWPARAVWGILMVEVQDMMTKRGFLINTISAALIAAVAVPAFAAINPKGDALEGREVGTPIRVKKNGKWVWDICVPSSGMKCDFNGQMKVAKGEGGNAGLVRMVSLDPKAMTETPPGIRAGRRAPGGMRLGCLNEDGTECAGGDKEGQQMGGDPLEAPEQIGSSGRGKKKKGQQMGPDFKEFMKNIEKVVELHLK
jgi:hypothetical protein